MPATKETLAQAQDMIDGIIKDKCCGPILVRLAWHDSGTYDKNVTGPWPAAGGAVGSIRFDPEIKHGANAGLSGALTLLQPVKDGFPISVTLISFKWRQLVRLRLLEDPKST